VAGAAWVGVGVGRETSGAGAAGAAAPGVGAGPLSERRFSRDVSMSDATKSNSFVDVSDFAGLFSAITMRDKEAGSQFKT
jgi:hypothetical protein